MRGEERRVKDVGEGGEAEREGGEREIHPKVLSFFVCAISLEISVIYQYRTRRWRSRRRKEEEKEEE